MGKTDEKNYLKNLGSTGIAHAAGKPFSDLNCWMYLVHLGNIMSILPPPPARILDLGVGTGWTSLMLAKAGYTVVGVDISNDMIDIARKKQQEEGVELNLSYEVSDYESIAFFDEFDYAIFYDSLHHASDESVAIKKALEALKPSGKLITHEPGQGHSKATESIKAVREYGITEKDMPPGRIIDIATSLGFKSAEVYNHTTRPNRVYPIGSIDQQLTKLWTGLKRVLGYRTHVKIELSRRNIVVLAKGS